MSGALQCHRGRPRQAQAIDPAGARLQDAEDAYATIKGFEVMRALRKGQARMFAIQGGVVGEVRIVERAFGIGPCALTEAMTLLQNHLTRAEHSPNTFPAWTTSPLRQVCNRAFEVACPLPPENRTCSERCHGRAEAIRMRRLPWHRSRHDGMAWWGACRASGRRSTLSGDLWSSPCLAAYWERLVRFPVFRL